MSRVVLASFDRVPSAKGAARHILGNAEVLASDHEVSLVTLGDRPIPGLRHRPLDIRERNWLRRALRFREAVEAVLAAHRFDVHHVRSPWEGLAVPARGALVYEVNGLYSIEMAYHHPRTVDRPALRRRLRVLELATLDRADLVLTPAPVTATYLEDLGVDPARIRVVPNRPSVSRVERAARSDDVVRLCYIGTLTPWQGLHAVLHVLPRLGERRWHLAIRTPTRKTRWLERLVRKRGLTGRVTIAGPLPPRELGRFLATQDLGLAPLTPCERNLVQGCMPIKVLDYLQAGLAVVGPDMPVVRHLVGDDAPLYRPWSRTSLTEVLARWIDDADLRAEWGARGRTRVEARFGAHAHRDALRAAYASIAPASTAA